MRSLITMYCTTPSTSHTMDVVVSTALRRLNSSENTSEVSTISALYKKYSGRAAMKETSAGSDRLRLNSSTTSVRSKANTGRKITLNLTLPVS